MDIVRGFPWHSRRADRLGSSEILGKLGEGGMDEVYRARDLTLGREVAIKVLAERLADEPGLRSRFEREARLLAALNHPQIASVYGIVESGSVRGLVLELVEGPTLADRLARGPMPVADALRIARQIALALEAAHDKGIVHRDLKPENVKLTSSGGVKVLDFGIEKMLSPGGVPDAGATTIEATREGSSASPPT